MSPPKLVTVYGATGAQGGSVVRSLIQNNKHEFKVRGLTRNPGSDSARELASLGIEVVKADGADRQSMVKAFEGSWAAFVNTNSDDPQLNDDLTEIELGHRIIDAAVEAGVNHFIYSGMASSTETTNGKLTSQAFDDKNAIGNYAQTEGFFATTTIVSVGWYMENFLLQDLGPIFGGFPWTPDSEGYYTFQSPLWGGQEHVPFISITTDLGDIVHAILLNPPAYNGRFIQAVSDIRSFDQLTSAFAQVTGKKARFVPLPSWTDLEIYGIKPLETVKTMFGFCQESGGRYFGVETENRTAAELKRIAVQARIPNVTAAAATVVVENPILMSLEEWCARHFGDNNGN